MMRRLVLAFVALLLPAGVAAAADKPPPALVGRVSFLSGQLGFHMPGETQWSAAAVNYPVATGGSFWTAPQARAEIRIGPQTIGISGNTALDIVQLDHATMRFALKQGRINLRLREIPDGGGVQVDVPRGAVKLLQPGVYDIDAGGEQEPARIAVFEGSAQFVGGPVDVAIKAGDVAVISGTETISAALERAQPDEFAEWCRSRDNDERRLAAAKRVSPRVTGYEALEGHGMWRSFPEYGEVWIPDAVPPGWAPYRDGSWVWVQPWGWTWVDAQPWGFAPSHYGRWAHVDQLWVWVPGPVVPEPVYAPALVVFIDEPAIIIEARARAPLVGWFPLGPNEPYWPWYSDDRGYFEAINHGIVRDLGALDRGTAVIAAVHRGAATVVPRGVFAKAERVRPAALRVSEKGLKRIALAAGPPGLRPGREHRSAHNKPGREVVELPGPGAGRKRFVGRDGREASAALTGSGRDKAERGGKHVDHGPPKHAFGRDRDERRGGGQGAEERGPKHSDRAGPRHVDRGPKHSDHAGPKHVDHGPKHSDRAGPRHVDRGPKHSDRAGPRHVDRGPKHSDRAGPKHVDRGPKHSDRAAPRHFDGGPKHFGGGKRAGGEHHAGGGNGHGKAHGGGGGKDHGGKGGGKHK